MFNKFTVQKSFAISAGAGSGKTYTLSRRYINCVLGFDFIAGDKEKDKNYPTFIEKKDNADVSQIVTMTYTEAAALEMKERIFELMQIIIDFDGTKNEENKNDFDSIKIAFDKIKKEEKEYVKSSLQTALNNSNNAFISTIHSFCLDTISRNSDIAKLDSKLSIIQDDEKQKILDTVRLEVLEKYKNTIEIFKQNNKFKVNQIIDKYATNAKFRESFDKFVYKPLDLDTYKAMIKELFPLPEVTQELLNEVSQNNTTKNWFDKYINNFENFEAKPWKDVEDAKAPTLSKDTLLKAFAINTTSNPLMKIYSQPIDADKENYFNTQIQAIQELLKVIHKRYLDELKKENKIDFDTIIAVTLEIVKKVSNDYKYIMVDEFQDTNSLQNDIVNTIAKDINLFVVGDSKQSIYSFQGAELEVFNNAVNKLEKVPMSINYRSDKEILTFVNEVFKELFEQEKQANQLISSNFKATFTEDDELQPSNEDKADGTVEFLISQEDGYQIIDNQMKDIAKFIKAIKDNTIEGYQEIKDAIKENKKAIGILFDSKTKMLELKKELDLLGVEAKVSATENFYHTKEINDIFLVLKATQVVKSIRYKLSKNPDLKLTYQERFYIVGALRSNILRYDERQIVELLASDIGAIIKIFENYINIEESLRISSFIKYIVDSSKLLDIYTYLGNIEQRYANIEKLIDTAIEFEINNSNDMYAFLKDLQRSIYFVKDSKEDEAFYKSENLESIELCTIHSTKGLAYPMVILAQSEKGLHTNASGDMGLSEASFTLTRDETNQDYSAIGFKVKEYEPLIYRILKKISKNKHEAEKKRLLYVALTRAKHNLVIAGSMYDKDEKATKNNPKPDRIIADISDNSYLGWMVNKTFNLDKETLFKSTQNDKINFIDKSKFENITGKIRNPDDLELVKYQEQIVAFKEKKKKIASDNIEHTATYEAIEKQAILGTTIHSILQRYWDKLEDASILETIYFKYNIFNPDIKTKIEKYIENFKTTTTYEKLKNGAIHHFEIELNMYDKENNWTQGIIDLVYFDEQLNGWVIVDFKSNNMDSVKDLAKFARDNGYNKQLDTYERLCESADMKVVGKVLLFLDGGDEVEIGAKYE